MILSQYHSPGGSTDQLNTASRR